MWSTRPIFKLGGLRSYLGIGEVDTLVRQWHILPFITIFISEGEFDLEFGWLRWGITLTLLWG